MITKLPLLFTGAVAAFLCSGCISFKQAQAVAITHSALPAAETQNRGAISIRRFSDGRKSEARPTATATDPRVRATTVSGATS